MKLTPLDIHHKEFHRSFRGYSEEEVDAFLDQVAEEFERLFNENKELKDKISQKSEAAEKFQDMGSTLQKTLIKAQQVADEVQKEARKESEMIVKDAEKKAQQMIQEALNRKSELEANIEDLKAAEKQFRHSFKELLSSYLKTIAKIEKGEAAASSEKGEEAGEFRVKVEPEVVGQTTSVEPTNEKIADGGSISKQVETEATSEPEPKSKPKSAPEEKSEPSISQGEESDIKASIADSQPSVTDQSLSQAQAAFQSKVVIEEPVTTGDNSQTSVSPSNSKNSPQSESSQYAKVKYEEMLNNSSFFSSAAKGDSAQEKDTEFEPVNFETDIPEFQPKDVKNKPQSSAAAGQKGAEEKVSDFFDEDLGSDEEDQPSTSSD